jgi:hypothetical protein
LNLRITVDSAAKGRLQASQHVDDLQIHPSENNSISIVHQAFTKSKQTVTLAFKRHATLTTSTG